MKPLKSYFLSQRDIPIAISNSDTKSIHSKPCEIEPKRLRIEREKERERELLEVRTDDAPERFDFEGFFELPSTTSFLLVFFSENDSVVHLHWECHTGWHLGVSLRDD